MKPYAIFAVLAFAGLAILPSFGQTSGTSGKSAPANGTTKKMGMCCMSGMNPGKMMSGMSASDKTKMGKCCMSGMKSAGMKPGDMKMGEMSAADTKKTTACCMAAMKSGDMKMDHEKKAGVMKRGDDKKPAAPPTGAAKGGGK